MDDCDSLGPRLEFSTDDKPRRSIPIGDSGIQIGRDSTVSVRFEDPRISRQHARIERHADGAFYLVDTSKHQATYLNGRRMLEARPVRLGDGDRIRVGDYEMTFRCESRVLPVEPEAGSTVLETLGDLSSGHLAARARRPAETLRAVLNVNRSLGGGGDLDQIMGRALGSLMELFPNTECGVIVTVEPDGHLPVRAVRHRGGPPPKLTLSRTILHRVLDQGEAALIRDAATDERFREHESVAALFRSALCVPLPGTNGRSLGMVQLGVQEGRRRRFTSEDLELLAALALPMAATVENDRLLRERRARRCGPRDPAGAPAPRAARNPGIFFLGVLSPRARGGRRFVRLYPDGPRRAGRRLPMGDLRGGRLGQGDARGVALGGGLPRGSPRCPERRLAGRGAHAGQPPRL